MDLQPWTFNQWLRYHVEKKQFNFQCGINFSQFFQQLNGITVVASNGSSVIYRYSAMEAGVACKFSSKAMLKVFYWHTFGLDKDAVQHSNYANATLLLTRIKISPKLNFNFFSGLFYVSNSLSFKGLFASLYVDLGWKNFPIRVFSQTVNPIVADKTAKNNMNFGLKWVF